MLKEQLKTYGIKVDEVTGLVNNQQRREAMEKADLVVGTSTIDIGIDFNISLLMFETLDAGSFLQRLGRVRQGEAPFDRYEAHALFSNRTPWIYERFVRRLHEQGIHDGEAIERPTTLRSLVIEQEVFPQLTAFKAYAKRWGILQAAHVLTTLEGRSREQSFLSLAQDLRERYQALFDLRDFTYAFGRYKHLLGSTRSQEQGPGRYILDEVLSFRGSSPFQAAVWDDSTVPANFIGYDALALIQNSDYRVIDEATYRAALEGLPSPVL
jgi:CRISPR-associated endonuclease/helicase Cas3